MSWNEHIRLSLAGGIVGMSVASIVGVDQPELLAGPCSVITALILSKIRSAING